MKIGGMDEFQIICREELQKWYNTWSTHRTLLYLDTFVVWSCKTLQNYKCLCSTNVDNDGVYAEFTYNGDKQELYMDVYVKQSNTVLK